MGAAPRRRMLPLRPAAASLAAALSAALATPALTIAGGSAMAATAAGTTRSSKIGARSPGIVSR